MILVDIYVPSLDKTYDFRLNETVPTQAITEEITEMIGRRERAQLHGSVDLLCLYDRGTGSLLPRENSLAECGIRSGSTLILV